MTITKETAIQNSGEEELINRINMIINLIPNNFAERNTVVTALKDRLDFIPYTAPEIMVYGWNEVSNILSSTRYRELSVDKTNCRTFWKTLLK